MRKHQPNRRVLSHTLTTLRMRKKNQERMIRKKKNLVRVMSQDLQIQILIFGEMKRMKKDNTQVRKLRVRKKLAKEAREVVSILTNQ
mgnify:CR=1 FL=1